MPKLRIVFLHKLSKKDVLTLRCPDGDVENWYGVAAVEGARVVGYWRFGKPRRDTSGKLCITSEFTRVIRRLRRTHLAQRLWDAGVAYWKPQLIYANAGSRAGLKFLQSAVIRYGVRGIRFISDDIGEGDVHHAALETALALLTKYQRRRQPARAKQTQRRVDGTYCGDTYLRLQ